MDIGKLLKVPVRDIWKREGRQFTPWLADNLQIIGDELNITINLIEEQKGVGKFACDILAEDQNGDYVVIECQFEKSDHDHLGKILTYLTGLNAKSAIWICEVCSPEHINAINWLNESTPTDTSFYLLTLEAVKIGESDPAPLFKVVCAPSEERKEMGKKKGELADRHVKRLAFWEQLLEKSRQKTKLFSNVSPGKENWLSAGAGKTGVGYYYQINMDAAYVYLYLDKGKGYDDLNKKWFDYLYSHKEAIEESYGSSLIWTSAPGRRSTMISGKVSDIGLKEEEKWDDIQDKLVDGMLRFEKALKSYISKLE